ncbi:hypothetical protein D3C72_1377680 [compost metagenome]
MQVGLDREALAVAHHALDAGLPPEYRRELADRAAAAHGDAEHAPDHLGRGAGGVRVVGAAAHGLPELVGFGAQVHAQQQRKHLARDHHDGDQPEDVGDGVGRDHVGLQLRDLGGGERQLRDRVGRRAHHRRFGGRARHQPGGRAAVERQQHGGAEHQREHYHHLDQAQQAQPQALGVEVGKELRTARVAERKDEEHEEHVLHAVVEPDAQLADHQRGNQRAADAAQLDRPETDLAHRVANAQHQKQCDLRTVSEYFHKVAEHVPRSLRVICSFERVGGSQRKKEHCIHWHQRLASGGAPAKTLFFVLRIADSLHLR